MAKSKSEARTLVIKALVSKSEKRLIEMEASRRHVSVSNFLRILALQTVSK